MCWGRTHLWGAERWIKAAARCTVPSCWREGRVWVTWWPRRQRCPKRCHQRDIGWCWSYWRCCVETRVWRASVCFHRVLISPPVGPMCTGLIPAWVHLSLSLSLSLLARLLATEQQMESVVLWPRYVHLKPSAWKLAACLRYDWCADRKEPRQTRPSHNHPRWGKGPPRGFELEFTSEYKEEMKAARCHQTASERLSVVAALYFWGESERQNNIPPSGN